MLLNDPYADIIAIRAKNDLTWKEIAEKMQTAFPQNVMDAAHRGEPSPSYVKLAEALGYDVYVDLVKKQPFPRI